jgi:hypothetical protein
MHTLLVGSEACRTECGGLALWTGVGWWDNRRDEMGGAGLQQGGGRGSLDGNEVPACLLQLLDLRPRLHPWEAQPQDSARQPGRKITAYAVYFPVDGASAGADARELQVWCGLKSRATDVERAINSYLYEDQELERLEEGLKKANLPRGDTAAQEQLVTALLKGVELLEPESEPVELEGTPAGTQSSQRASRCDCETSL